MITWNGRWAVHKRPRKNAHEYQHKRHTHDSAVWSGSQPRQSSAHQRRVLRWEPKGDATDTIVSQFERRSEEAQKRRSAPGANRRLSCCQNALIQHDVTCNPTKRMFRSKLGIYRNSFCPADAKSFRRHAPHKVYQYHEHYYKRSILGLATSLETTLDEAVSEHSRRHERPQAVTSKAIFVQQSHPNTKTGHDLRVLQWLLPQTDTNASQ